MSYSAESDGTGSKQPGAAPKGHNRKDRSRQARRRTPESGDARRAERPARRRVVTGFASAVVALALVSTGCTNDDQWGSGLMDPRTPAAGEVAALRSLDDCADLVDAASLTLDRAVDSMWSDIDESSGLDYTEGFATADAQPSSDGSDTLMAAPPSTTAAQAPNASAEAASGSRASDPEKVISTNNQEAGVDEGDIVKTDGSRIVSTLNGTLRVVVLDDNPQVDGTLDLGSDTVTEMFLRGDEVVLLGTAYAGSNYGPTPDGPIVMEGDVAELRSPDTVLPNTVLPNTVAPTTTTTIGDDPTPTTVAPTSTIAPTTVPTTAPTTVPTTTVPTTTTEPTTTTTLAPMPQPVPIPFDVATTVTRVSIADPTDPTVVEQVAVEGDLVTSRMIDGRVRLVVRSEPEVLQRLYAAQDESAADAIVDRLDSSDLLPRVAADGTVRTAGSCGDVLSAMPVAMSPTDAVAPSDSLENVTVLTIGDSLTDLQPVTVQGRAETVYASTSALYVASGSWDEGGSRTDIHRFDLATDGAATYTGSGQVPGRLLNQFSLSDAGATLRVVTTMDDVQALPTPDTPTAAAPSTMFDPGRDDIAIDIAPAPSATEARLTVLDTDGTLDEIAMVDGLGRGEEVQSVRYLGDLAYVVTFRQTDPLYAIDLSDPSDPTVLGELKIPGFSEYLHPLGDGLLLGIGRDADPTTGFDQGFKASLFDVSDPTQMVELDTVVIADAYSEVSNNHKAFTWDPERRQAILPVERSCADMTARSDCATASSAVVLRVDGSSLVEAADIRHGTDGYSAAPFRSMIVDDDLWTLSYVGLGRSDADDPGRVDVIRF